MSRSPAAIVCVLLALLASPCGEVGGLFALLSGGAGCGSDACCCADAGDVAGSCCGDDAQRSPQLVNGCRCGTHEGGSLSVAPMPPRTCSDQAMSLPGLRPARAARRATAAPPGEHPESPEPPPPRLRD